jgi:hypothetical protein
VRTKIEKQITDKMNYFVEKIIPRFDLINTHVLVNSDYLLEKDGQAYIHLFFAVIQGEHADDVV